MGRIDRWERAGQDHILEISAPKEVMRYVVFKGSIAVDGISLTVAAVQKKSFRVWIIPHTWEVTNLKERKVGDRVNLGPPRRSHVHPARGVASAQAAGHAGGPLDHA